MLQIQDVTARWAAFRTGRRDADRTWLVEHYKPLVEEVLRTFRNVRRQDQDDLRGAGNLGLIESVDKWDPARMEWLRFAKFRIRAAMVDHIRSVSWVPKSVRSVARKVELWEDRLAAKLGRMPTIAELAEALGRTEEETADLLATIRGTDWTVASLDHTPDGEGSWLEALADPGAETPEAATVRREELDALELILQRLPARLRAIIKWRYFDYPRKSQKQIAQELGVHESRISQLLDDAFARARRLSNQPWVLFEEVYEEGGRLTCRE
jgi:RNA polymerase sigma factor for flagellar operon FliA